MHRVGFLLLTAPRKDDGATRIVLAMAEHGYVERRNLTIERRYAFGRSERLPALARELVDAGVDVMVVVGLAGARAAREASTTVPTVFYGNFDPLRAGLVQSLARPGGNLTGVLIAPDGSLAAKRLELLREVMKDASPIGVLAPDDENFAAQLDELRRAAANSNTVLNVAVVKGGDYERAFRQLSGERVSALFVGGHSYFASDQQRIIELAARHRLPASYEWLEQVEAGGLMSYGSDLGDLRRRVAAYVDRILSGAKAGDLPIDRPTTFGLAVNLSTAKALGLAIPPSVLQRADRIVR